MDFQGRGSQPAQPASTSASFGSASGSTKKSKSSDKKAKALRLGGGVLGLLVLVLVVAVIGVIAFGGKNTEAQYVDETKLQAVFLQTGQVYFGKIDKDKVTGNSFVMNDIYYLQTSNTGAAAQQSSNTNVSLVKLGCELHAPRDQMVINRDQVTFWENLNESGQVAKAVATFKKDNPNGQKCADQGTAPNTNSNVQGTPNTNTGGTGSSTTPSTNSGN